jgi:hypothetical protein
VLPFGLSLPAIHAALVHPSPQNAALTPDALTPDAVDALARAGIGLDAYAWPSVAVTCLASLVAALFRPVRTRLQTAVDRRFYRRRYDAARRLRPSAPRFARSSIWPRSAICCSSAADETMQPTHASLWLVTPDARTGNGAGAPHVVRTGPGGPEQA